MARRILVFIYIALVLVLSGLAKANAAIVNKVEINQITGILTAHGVLSTPCQNHPYVVIEKIDETTGIIELDVNSVNSHKICVDVLGERFDIALDLKELPLIEGRTYIIGFKTTSDELKNLKYKAVKVDESVKIFRVNKQNFKGLLVHLEESGFALSDGNQRVPVVSPQINLALFQDNQVWLSGYVVHLASISDGAEPKSPAVIIPVSIGGIRP